MIKLIVALDENGCLGQRSCDGAPWYGSLQDQFRRELERYYRSADLIVVGQNAFSDLVPRNKRGFVVTRGQPKDLSETKLKHCDDMSTVVAKHESSADEVAVIGGATMFGLFLPHAAVIDLLVSKSSFQGDLKFTAWNDGSFELVDERDQGTFVMRRMFRI